MFLVRKDDDLALLAFKVLPGASSFPAGSRIQMLLLASGKLERQPKGMSPTASTMDTKISCPSVMLLVTLLVS